MRDFLRGMASISLFPKREKRKHNFKILSNEEAFEKNLKAIGGDMWQAISIIQKEFPEYL